MNAIDTHKTKAPAAPAPGASSGRVVTSWTDTATGGRTYPAVRTETPGTLRNFAQAVRRMLTRAR